MNYSFSLENLKTTYPEFEPLYRKHYSEMQTRLAGQGVVIPDFNPDLKTYFDCNDTGVLLHYCVRQEGAPVGYSNIYLFKDMHNGALSAEEDTIYLLPEHRNGTGRIFSKFILADLEKRGATSLKVMAMTDLRVEKLWKRMGFIPVATTMIYRFGK